MLLWIYALPALDFFGIDIILLDSLEVALTNEGWRIRRTRSVLTQDEEERSP